MPLFFLPMMSAAQSRVSITGTQQRMQAQNAKLSCSPVTLSRAMQGDSVSGFHNGFWIVKGGKTDKAFWTSRHVSSAIGYTMQPGTYTVYPNLPQASDTASVTIWLRKK